HGINRAGTAGVFGLRRFRLWGLPIPSDGANLPPSSRAPIIYRVVETGGPDGSPSFSRIRSVLAGRRVLVTGVTGFLGTALLERLLVAVPDARLVLLIRPRDGVPATTRLRREVVAGAAFDP